MVTDLQAPPRRGPWLGWLGAVRAGAAAQLHGVGEKFEADAVRQPPSRLSASLRSAHGPLAAAAAAV